MSDRGGVADWRGEVGYFVLLSLGLKCLSGKIELLVGGSYGSEDSS